MEKTKFIKRARSKGNGIVFYSNSCPNLGVEAFLENGESYTRIVPAELTCQRDYAGMLFELSQMHIKRNTMLLMGLSFMMALIALNVFNNIYVFWALSWFGLTVAGKLVSFLTFVYQLKMGNQKQTARFHGAEHKVINAYEKLQRIPTLEEARNASCFSKNCGSRYDVGKFLLFMAMFFYMIFVAPKVSGIKYIIGMILMCLVIIILTEMGTFKFFQILFTYEPTDKELETAIKGLEVIDELNSLSELFSIPIGNVTFGTINVIIGKAMQPDGDDS